MTKDPERPFIVKTKTVQTRVLGTEFNIRSYTPEDTHVVLINGKVEVSNTKGGYIPDSTREKMHICNLMATLFWQK